jgi:hypothetical protein
VRGLDPDGAPRPDQAVELFHRPHDVRDVLDHVDREQAVKGVVAKWVRVVVEIA